MGHVTEVQAYDTDVGTARIAIAFDHAELKNGQSIAIYTLIRGVVPSGGAVIDQRNQARLEDDGGGGGMMGMPAPAGAMVNGGRMDAGRGGGAPGAATNDIDRASDTAVDDWRRDQLNQSPSRRTGLGGKHNGSGRRPRKHAYRRSCGCGGPRYSSYDANSRRDAGRKQLLLGSIAVTDQEYSI